MVIVHVSHPYKSVDHTMSYAFIIRFLVFIFMCRAVKVLKIELNAPLAISIIFTNSSSHFPFDVSLSQIRVVVSLFDDININLHNNVDRSYILGN